MLAIGSVRLAHRLGTEMCEQTGPRANGLGHRFFGQVVEFKDQLKSGCQAALKLHGAFSFQWVMAKRTAKPRTSNTANG